MMRVHDSFCCAPVHHLFRFGLDEIADSNLVGVNIPNHGMCQRSIKEAFYKLVRKVVGRLQL